MSDMLNQLVVEIHNTQALILPLKSHIESSQSGRQAEEALAKVAAFTLIERLSPHSVRSAMFIAGKPKKRSALL